MPHRDSIVPVRALNLGLRLLLGLLALAAVPLPLAAQTPAASTAELEAAVRADPQSASARVKLGKQYYREGRYRDAAKQWNRVLTDRGASIKPAQRATICRCIALALHRSGDGASARRYIERARQDAPTDSAVLKVAGIIAAPASPAPAPVPSPAPSAAAPAAPESSVPTRFVRVGDLGGGKHALQTACVTMASPDGRVRVVLDGVTHVGERQYYEGIQKSLEARDSVLFEAVVMTPGDTQGMGKANPNDPAQNMARNLGLEAQTLVIDYKKPNFVWADITLPEMFQYQKSAAFAAAAAGPKSTPSQGPGYEDLNEADMREMITPRRPGRPALSAERQRALRSKMALSFECTGGDLTAGDAINKGTAELLIYRRNDYVMSALTHEIEAKKRSSISILYGAAHMPDIARRLDCQGYKVASIEWRNAWTY